MYCPVETVPPYSYVYCTARERERTHLTGGAIDHKTPHDSAHSVEHCGHGAARGEKLVVVHKREGERLHRAQHSKVEMNCAMIFALLISVLLAQFYCASLLYKFY